MEAHSAEYVAIIAATKSLVDKTDLSGLDPELYKKIKNIPGKLPVVKKADDIPDYVNFRKLIQLLYTVPNAVLSDISEKLYELDVLLDKVETEYRVIQDTILLGIDLTKIDKTYLDVEKFQEFSVEYIKTILAHNRSETNLLAYAELERMKTELLAKHASDTHKSKAPTYPNATYNLEICERFADLKTLLSEYFKIKGNIMDLSKEFSVDVRYIDLSSPVFYDTQTLTNPYVYPEQYGLNQEIIQRTRTITYVSSGSNNKNHKGESKTVISPKNTSVVFIIKYHDDLTALMGLSGNPIIPKTYFTAFDLPNPRISGYNNLLSTAILSGLEQPLALEEERENATIGYNSLAAVLIKDITDTLENAVTEKSTNITNTTWLNLILKTVGKSFYKAFSGDNSPEIALTLYHTIDYSLTNLLNIITEKWADVTNISSHPDAKRYAVTKITEILNLAVREITRKNDNIYSVIGIKQQLIN